MSNPKKPKEEMTEDYKKALAEKQAKEAKEREQKLRDEMLEKQSIAKAKREAEAKKREIKSLKLGEKISECDAEILKAKKTIENGQKYELVGMISLWLSTAMVVLVITVSVLGIAEAEKLLVPMIIAWIILCISIFFQTRPLFAESSRRKNLARKRRLRQELYETKNHR